MRSGRVNWDFFFRLCDSQLILPTVYLSLSRHRLVSFLPKEMAEYSIKVLNLNRERNVRIVKQISDINRMLSEHGIYPVYLKGTANLPDGLFASSDLRMMFDLVLLSRKQDAVLARPGLNNNRRLVMGYRRQVIKTLIYPGYRKAGLRRIHGILFKQKSTGPGKS